MRGENEEVKGGETQAKSGMSDQEAHAIHEQPFGRSIFRFLFPFSQCHGLLA